MNEGIYTAKYKGKPIMGYKPGNIYQINIEKQKYVYNVEAIDSKNTKLIQYASEISIKQSWEIKDY